MARIDHVADEAADERTEEIFAAAEGQFGFVPNIARTMANSPVVADGFIGTEGELFGSSELGHELLEKVGVAVSVANGCDYCVDAHAHSLLRNVDADEAEIAAIRERRFGDLPERERVAVEFAVAAAESPGSIPEERYDALTDAFDDGEIADVVGTAALFQGINLFADALEVAPDE